MTGLLVYRTTQLLLLFPVNKFYFFSTLCFPPINLPVRKGRFHNHSYICGLPEEAGIRLNSSTASSGCPREGVVPQLLCLNTRPIQVFPALHWFCSCSLPLLLEEITHLVLPAFPGWWWEVLPFGRGDERLVLLLFLSHPPEKQELTPRAVGQITAPRLTTLSAGQN